MAISESDRFEFYLGMKKFLGDDMADILMEYLPPAGWGDVARRSDVHVVEQVLSARFAVIEARLDGVETRLTSLDHRQKLMLSGGLTMGLALLAMMVDLMLRIPR